MENLIAKVEEIAKEKFDGHYSIFSFTTNYKGGFGTLGETDELDDMKSHKSLELLLNEMIKSPDKYNLWNIEKES